MSENVGRIVGINGNLATVRFDNPVTQGEVGFARTGDIALKAEVIRIRGENAELQVFEDTSGLRVGDPVEFTGNRLTVELGPGLLAQVYGWHVGFGAAGVMMLVATIIYLSGQRHLPDPRPSRRERASAPTLTAPERRQVALLMAVALMWARRREGWAFLAMTVVVAGVVALLFGSLYPNLLPSTLNPEWSVTIYNGSSTGYTLTIMTWASLTLVPLVIAYQAWTYWVFRRRITAEAIPAPVGFSRRMS